MNKALVLAFLFPVMAILAGSAASDGARSWVAIAGWNDGVYTAREARYRLYSRNDDFDLAGTPFQARESKKPSRRGALVTVVAGRPGTKKAPGPEDLADTPFLGLTDPGIAKTAARFRNSKDPLGDVASFVHAHITDKTLGIPMMSAPSVFRHRAGDCTEHSVLAAALLRANGIPCRAAAGMLSMKSFMGKERVFVFHMWVEAWHGGRWHIVDAANPDRPSAARYVNLSYHNLKTEMPLPYMRAISAIEDLSAELVR